MTINCGMYCKTSLLYYATYRGNSRHIVTAQCLFTMHETILYTSEVGSLVETFYHFIILINIELSILVRYAYKSPTVDFIQLCFQSMLLTT